MSSSRYRDDRDDRRYPPSSQNRFPPSSHAHDSRPPSYPSAYPPPSHFSNDSSGSRFAPVVAGGSRSYDERGNYSSGSGGGGSAYASSSRYDDRRDRTGRDYVERAVGRDTRGAVGGDFRNSSTQTSQGRTGKAREDDRIFASGYTTTLSHSKRHISLDFRFHVPTDRDSNLSSTRSRWTEFFESICIQASSSSRKSFLRTIRNESYSFLSSFFRFGSTSGRLSWHGTGGTLTNSRN